jgi:arabinose-5-phosphate isomerase
MITPVLQTALKTIALEAESVSGLAAFIDESFEKVIQAIHQSKGRVVISGIGKSAIVGQKIVATLNSTGTPALFMHAADAIHGDLGMIQRDDVVLVISKSGESPEIKVLVPLIRNFGNTLIGMVGQLNSFLAKQADLVLNTTVSQEACPNNLAPTSSTTAQMVMGDTIAICLMHLNEFTGHDFARYHPGGNLGKRMYLRVSDLCAQNAKPEVLLTSTLKEVIMVISKSRLGTAVVIDAAQKVLGIITDGDVRRMLERVDDISTVKAADMLTTHPKTIEPGALAVDALEVLRSFDISQLVVVNEKEEYAGVLHLHDLVREGII